MAAAETLTLEGLARWSEGQAEAFARADLTKPMRAIALLLANVTKANFVAAADPDGNRWAPLKSSRRNGTTHPLWDTGRLVGAVGAGAGHVEEVTPRALVFGTNVEYAAYHQYGTGRVPQRQFLGVTERMADVFAELIADYLGGQL